MVKLNSLLSQRFKKSNKEKVNALAERSTNGELSGFSGVFNVSELSSQEQKEIRSILENFKDEDQDTSTDLNNLMTLTSEVKAINNQAIILHGERIKKAQSILKNYKDGAFSAWLVATYGNRQTPYNFLQYFDFYTNLTPLLKEKADEMPKQAIYTLASRDGEMAKKEEMIKKYKGESKKDLLEAIRSIFPLAPKDKRQGNVAQSVIKSLERLEKQAKQSRFKPTREEKGRIQELLSQIESALWVALSS